MKVVGFEKGGITSDIKDKPAIRYDISSAKDQATTKGGAGAPPVPETK